MSGTYCLAARRVLRNHRRQHGGSMCRRMRLQHRRAPMTPLTTSQARIVSIHSTLLAETLERGDGQHRLRTYVGQSAGVCLRERSKPHPLQS